MKNIKSFNTGIIHYGLILLLLIGQMPLAAFGQKDRGAGNIKTVAGEKRLALIIGNGAYKNTTTLDNPVNDADDMTKTLKSLDFEVLSGTNQTKKQMENLIRDFGDKLAKNGGVGLFFYAGHGIQYRGGNYLIPIEAEIPAEDEIEYAAVNLNFLLGKMDAAQNNLNIVILDACRNNPFARSWRNFRDMGDGKGLAKVTPPTGTIMLYATQPGNVASDGSGRNGLFTESLLKQITKPDVEFDAMVKSLARDVSDKSGKKQLPWKEGIVLGDFYFAGRSQNNNTANNNKPANEPPPTVEIDKNAGEREAWNQIKDSTNRSDYALFVETFPNGIYAATAKQKWEQIWWEAIKNSTNKTDFEAFLKQFPTGQYASSANFAVKRLEAASANTKPIKTVDNNTNAERTAGAISKAKLPNGAEMSFVYIPAGEFQMGSTNGDDDEKPVHMVKISQGFFMGQTEVTQGQWKAVMGTTVQQQRDKANPSWSLNSEGANYPMYYVSWEDAQQFINKLNAQNDGYKYRLPTEAEWEYAARAGTTGDYAGNLDSMAWYYNNSGNQKILGDRISKGIDFDKLESNYNRTHEVATKQANAWGLFDMHGNVWEWCQDWKGSYPSGTVTNPTGATSGTYRVYRGGSWDNPAPYLRSALRFNNLPSGSNNSLGFRVVRQ